MMAKFPPERGALFLPSSQPWSRMQLTEEDTL